MNETHVKRPLPRRDASAGPLSAAPGRARPPERRAVVCGVGSVGRPIATGLPALGVTHLTVVDAKCYTYRSALNQCAPTEVLRPKAEVVAEVVQRDGLTVVAHAEDLYSVPDGVLREGALLISCTDNTRALIRANRWAARMRRPLLKVNIEPLLDCVSLRAYRACDATSACAECQLSDRHYEHQQHPHSCDAAPQGRRTASSRELAAAAAELALRAARDILDDDAAADDWFGWETQCHLGSDRLVRSRLERYDSCRWAHDAHWQNVFWLVESPQELRLEQLVPPAQRRAPADVTLHFDHPVTRWACCNHCPRRVRHTQWLASLSADVGCCPACGRGLRPFPFGMREQLTLWDLRDVWARPLAAWGVPSGAVIQVTAGHHSRTFVVGGAAPAAQNH